jgi:5-methylcytosine-specific restriction endonuclease McrA
MPVPSATSQLDFLQNVQAVLEDGQFVATYKFALLVALADLAVESGVADDAPCPILLTDIAAKFVEYYWQQVAPFAGASNPEVLAQNSGRQASVASLLVAERQRANTLAQLRVDANRWRSIVARVARTIREMPLYRLQIVAGKLRPFMYEHDDDATRVVLKPGVAYHLRRFHPLVTGLARDRWMAQIRRIPANLYAIGQTQDLETFLFGADRSPIARHLPVLRMHQRGLCLYCGSRLHEGDAQVDHFVPWSLHRFDALPNLVAAHAHCNRDKRDLLAAESHLERWVERNDLLRRKASADLDSPAGATDHDPDPAYRIAAWAYGRAFDIQAAVWIKGRQTETLSGAFRSMLGS